MADTSLTDVKKTKETIDWTGLRLHAISTKLTYLCLLTLLIYRDDRTHIGYRNDD